MTKNKSRHSKGMSSGSFGAEVVFRCPEIRSDLFVSRMHEFIWEVAKRIEGQPKALLGHAKMFVQTDCGFLKLSVVDSGLGVESINELTADKLSGGRIRIMAVAIGVKDAVIEGIIEDEASKLSPVIWCEILEHHQNHEHEHEHHCACGHGHEQHCGCGCGHNHDREHERHDDQEDRGEHHDRRHRRKRVMKRPGPAE